MSRRGFSWHSLSPRPVLRWGSSLQITQFRASSRRGGLLLCDYAWDELNPSQPKERRALQVHTAVISRLSGKFYHLQSKSFQVLLNFLDLNLPSLNLEEGCEAWVSLDEVRQSAGSLIGELSNKTKTLYRDAQVPFDYLLFSIDRNSSKYTI